MVLPFAVVLCASSVGLAGRAADVAADRRIACATDFVATKIDGDPNAAVVRIIDPLGPVAGTITAFGATTQSSGTIEQSALAESRIGSREASLVVRADAPIEGIIYAPAWASCTFHAGVRPRTGYDTPDIRRPELVLANLLPVDPVTCSRPYIPPSTTGPALPATPAMAQQQGITGTVRVAVALDEHGAPQYARIVASPSVFLNAISINAALKSRYSPAVFRCSPVPSGYEFLIDFSSRY
jgi:hypothetical protein